MKKIIIVSIILGVIFSFIIFFSYKDSKKDNNSNFKETYFLQVGAYKNYKNVSNMTASLPTFLVSKESDTYHVYVAITSNKNNVEKLKKIYNQDIYINTKNINDDEFLNTIETYDYLLSESENKDVIYSINQKVLSNYENCCIR